MRPEPPDAALPSPPSPRPRELALRVRPPGLLRPLPPLVRAAGVEAEASYEYAVSRFGVWCKGHDLDRAYNGRMRVTRGATVGVLMLAASFSACGKTKPSHADGAFAADAAGDAMMDADAAAMMDAAETDGATIVDALLDRSDRPAPPASPDAPFDAADVPTMGAAADGGCLGAGATTFGAFSKTCCPGLVVAQSRSTGQYTCVSCVDAGQLTFGSFNGDCCPGLASIVSGSGPPQVDRGLVLNCDIGLDSRVCSRCGDGICDDWERPCGCPQDCGAACGAENCPLGMYCLENAPRTDGGTVPRYQCVDIASDCTNAYPSCRCTTAQTCASGCDQFSERAIVRCQ